MSNTEPEPTTELSDETLRESASEESIEVVPGVEGEVRAWTNNGNVD